MHEPLGKDPQQQTFRGLAGTPKTDAVEAANLLERIASQALDRSPRTAESRVVPGDP
jgi:hypothetical protein